jgi:hypothetical protein
VQLQTQQAVRTAQGSLRSMAALKDENRAHRVAVASYLFQLAEQVRIGDVEAFSLTWTGEDRLSVDVCPTRQKRED